MLLVFAGGGCATQPRSETTAHASSSTDTRAPSLFNLGTHTRTITTTSPLAQRHFDQGLNWAYAFNHDEAIRNFRFALTADPDCAMAWWGIALCNGPHINNPMMDLARSRAAWSALSNAREIANRPGNTTTDTERGLINALVARYTPCDETTATVPMLPTERAPFDRAYAEEMAKLAANFPNDNDILTLYSESLMDTRPWDLWAADGKPHDETVTIVATLETVLARSPNHPGANHLYIHAVEASPTPERANAAADRLRKLVPDSGHMVHMPSHIDVRTGRWAMASDTNAAAILVHDAYVKRSPRQDFYRGYMMHNHHFLAYSCMMEGRSADAIAAARHAVASPPADWVKTNAMFIDGYMPIALEALMRFGKWDEILREPKPPAHLPITTAFWRFTRAVAYAAKGNVAAAREEQRLFREQVATIPPEALMAINPAHKVLSIADRVIDAEIAFRENNVDSAIAHLREAIKVEDTLMYMEPPDWVQPVRNTLGAFLLQAGRTDEAERVYREDLARWPENGWSILGLRNCAEQRSAPASELKTLNDRLERAWIRADIKPTATCLCVTNAKAAPGKTPRAAVETK